VLSLRYPHIINFDFPDFEQRKSIYPRLIDQPLLTVIIGARCLDGIVLVADRKLTWTNGQVSYTDKIIGDIEHFLMGYTGDADTFDIFRRYTVGDLVIERDTQNRYTLENLLLNLSKSIRRFNELGGSPFKVLMCSHKGEASVLYHIEKDGSWNEVRNYTDIGSGSTFANTFCGKLDLENTTMREFAKHAYLAIMFMNQYYPALGVGVEHDDTPDIRYMGYKEQWDIDPTKNRQQDIEDFKKYTNQKLQEFEDAFERIVK
jgi:20S proteasome alpha/beta subunit